MPTTFEKTWTVDANRAQLDPVTNTVLAQTRSLAFYMKAFLTGALGGATQGLWTVVGSSDGVTASATDGVDRWGATYDATKLIRASTGTAHSWIVLKSPNVTIGGITNTPFYFVIDISAALDYQLTLQWSKNAPSGGSVTTRPTGGDDWSFVGQQVTYSAASAARKLSGWLAADGSFAFVGVMPAAGMAELAIMFHVLSDVRANELYPAASYAAWSQTALGGGFNSADSGWQARTRDGSAVVSTSSGLGWIRSPSTNPPAIFPNSGDASDSTWIELPTYFISATPYSIRGRVADFVAAAPSGTSLAANNGIVEPASGSPTSEILGPLWVPLTGTAVTL